jgi:hypothetical protein
VAVLLGVSESQVGIWSRAGEQQVLHPVRIPGIRAVRFRRDEVEGLARQWCGSQSVA